MQTHTTRADYDQLAQIAQRFGREAESTQRMLDAVRGAMNVLQAGDWVGQGANAFYAEMNGQVLPSLMRLVAALQSAQRNTLEIRAAIQQAEADAAAVLHDEGASYSLPTQSGSKGPGLAKPEGSSRNNLRNGSGGDHSENPFKDPCKPTNPWRWVLCPGGTPLTKDDHPIFPISSSDGEYQVQLGPSGTVVITHRSTGGSQVLSSSSSGGDPNSFWDTMRKALIALGAGIVAAWAIVQAWLASQTSHQPATGSSSSSSASGGPPANVPLPPGYEQLPPAEREHMKKLAWDDDVAEYKPGEASAARAFEKETGVELERAPGGTNADYVEKDSRKNWDVAGSIEPGADPAKYDPAGLVKAIQRKLAQGKNVIIPLSQLPQAARESVRKYVDGLPEAERSRIKEVQ